MPMLYQPQQYKIILIGSKNNHNILISILGNQVLNIGVVFDSNLTLSDHVSQVIKSTRVNAKDRYRIPPLLDLKTSVLLEKALVSSRLDYCNSLFEKLTDFELRRLQCVQNSVCRVVNHSSKFSHITPVEKNSISDACTPPPGEIVFSTMRDIEAVKQ